MGIREDLVSGRFIDEEYKEKKELSKINKNEIEKELERREYLDVSERYNELKKYKGTKANAKLKKYSDSALCESIGIGKWY